MRIRDISLIVLLAVGLEMTSKIILMPIEDGGTVILKLITVILSLVFYPLILIALYIAAKQEEDRLVYEKAVEGLK